MFGAATLDHQSSFTSRYSALGVCALSIPQMLSAALQRFIVRPRTVIALWKSTRSDLPRPSLRNWPSTDAQWRFASAKIERIVERDGEMMATDSGGLDRVRVGKAVDLAVEAALDGPGISACPKTCCLFNSIAAR